MVCCACLDLLDSPSSPISLLPKPTSETPLGYYSIIQHVYQEVWYTSLQWAPDLQNHGDYGNDHIYAWIQWGEKVCIATCFKPIAGLIGPAATVFHTRISRPNLFQISFVVAHYTHSHFPQIIDINIRPQSPQHSNHVKSLPRTSSLRPGISTWVWPCSPVAMQRTPRSRWRWITSSPGARMASVSAPAAAHPWSPGGMDPVIAPGMLGKLFISVKAKQLTKVSWISAPYCP